MWIMDIACVPHLLSRTALLMSRDMSPHSTMLGRTLNQPWEENLLYTVMGSRQTFSYFKDKSLLLCRAPQCRKQRSMVSEVQSHPRSPLPRPAEHSHRSAHHSAISSTRGQSVADELGCLCHGRTWLWRPGLRHRPWKTMKVSQWHCKKSIFLFNYWFFCKRLESHTTITCTVN